MNLRMQEEVMYLRADADSDADDVREEEIDATIQEAIDELVGKNKSLVDQFGNFRTEKIPAPRLIGTRTPKAPAYIRLVIQTANYKAYDALYVKLGAVPLGD